MKNKRAKVNTPVENLNPEDTIQHYNAVMFEDINSKMSTVIEGMINFKQEITREIKEFRTEVNERFVVVEAVVRKNSVDIQKNSKDIVNLTDHVEGNSKDIKELSGRVDNNSKDIKELSGRVDNLTVVVEDNSRDVRALSEDHEKRITRLEGVV